MPLVTIGMPLYNAGRNDGRPFKRALDSLLKQTFTDFKVVMVDNASTDDTAKIIKREVKHDPRFYYQLNDGNWGFYYNATRAMMACESKYYVQFHFDYYFAPTFLEECVNVLEADPGVMIAYSHCQFVDHAGNLLDLYQETTDLAHKDAGQRYLNLLNHVGWCTAYHGVQRYWALTWYLFQALGRRNAAWDNEILATVALRGKLVEIPKPLIFRHKDAYQKEKIPLSEHFDRLYFNYHAYRRAFFLPYCTWIHDHCQDILETGLPPARKDELIHQTVSILLRRYETFLDCELTRAVRLVLTGEFKRGVRRWEGDNILAKNETDVPPKGQYKYLDFVYLAQLVKDLEYANFLRPDFPKLSLARAVVRLELGQPGEAWAALETAYKQDPDNKEVQELRAKLMAVQGKLAGAPG